MSTLRVTETRYVVARDHERAKGLLAWISVVISDALVLDGLTLRRTRDGELRVSYPERTDGAGRRHPIVRPINEAARTAIEEQILQALFEALEGPP